MPDSEKEPIAKAYMIGLDVLQKADSKSDDGDGDGGATLISLFKTDGIEPPYDLTFLCQVYEHSNSLRQNVNAYMTNIDGFGHVFEPLIELREAGARDIVRDELWLERQTAAAVGADGSAIALVPPSEDEITSKIEELRSTMRVEKARIESFFDNCVAESSYVSLRQLTREDLEITGNAYWEVIRNDAGQVVQFAYMPSRTVRVSTEKSAMVDVEREVRVGSLSYHTETFRRRFRRYIQASTKNAVYFKEYEDPSVVSDRSGKSYDSVELLKAEEPRAEPANEVFHFKIPSLRTAQYGIPRWIGNLLSVLGSRSAEEVNYAYFENKSIPPMAILVSGGRLGSESVKRIQDFVETQLKGKKNFHKILVIEAETSAGSIGLSDTAGAMRVEIKQLTDAQLKDGLFLAYDAANLDKVGMGFRLPRLLRGDIRDFNRASAESALDFAESQVFVPERNAFDFIMNRFFLPTLGVKLWRFKSNGPRLSDSLTWGDMITKLSQAGILTPEDARELVSKKILGTELPRIDADWVKQPLPLTIAGVQLDSVVDGIIPLPNLLGDPGAAPFDPNAVPPSDGVTPQPTLLAAAKARILNEAKRLVKVRDAFRNHEAADAVAKFKADRIDEGELIFNMTADEMEKRFAVTRS